MTRPTHDSPGARAAREASPGLGHCGRCGFPWRWCGTEPHETWYTVRSACFPLCEDCWLVLDTPEARLPYYMALIESRYRDFYDSLSPDPKQAIDADLVSAQMIDAVLAGM